jgi:hypothetical protein
MSNTGDRIKRSENENSLSFPRDQKYAFSVEWDLICSRTLLRMSWSTRAESEQGTGKAAVAEPGGVFMEEKEERLKESEFESEFVNELNGL